MKTKWNEMQWKRTVRWNHNYGKKIEINSYGACVVQKMETKNYK